MSAEEIPLILNDVLQVPLFHLTRHFRSSQKSHEQGATSVLRAIRDLHQKATAKEATGDRVAPDKAIAALDKIASKLKEVREEAKAASSEMQSNLETLTFRLAMRNSSLSMPESHDSKRARSSHEFSSGERMLELAMISNHLLRTNRFETYKTLCREAECEYLVQDVDTFRSHAEIIHALLQQHDAEPALQWCVENRSALKKKNSSLEFDLRLRQFCGIVSDGQSKEAVLFARKHLAQNAHEDKMRKAMATLAYPVNALNDTPYQSLFSDERWNDVVQEFLSERNAVLMLNRVSPLEIVVRVGLSVIKTNSCRPDGPGRAAGCPACQPSLGKLAYSVPRTLRERSALVCRISGQLMEEPLVLPNGQAYSKATLEQMAQARGDGRVLCPVTHQEFYLRDAKRAYVL